MLNETVNTEAFSSPKSDLVTSSPHAGAILANERDAGVISVSSMNGYSLSGFQFQPLDLNGIYSVFSI